MNRTTSTAIIATLLLSTHLVRAAPNGTEATICGVGNDACRPVTGGELFAAFGFFTVIPFVLLWMWVGFMMVRATAKVAGESLALSVYNYHTTMAGAEPEKRFGRTATITRVKEVKHRQTGSAFSATRMSLAEPIPGSHAGVGEVKDGDLNAFNPGKVTSKRTPKEFLRRGQGMGGNATPAAAEAFSPGAGKKAAGPRGGPPKAGARQVRANPPNTELRRFYERGDLPCIIDQRGVHNKLAWRARVEELDYHHYLPLFFTGLREQEFPYNFIAREGIFDLLENGGPKILPVIPQLIIPLKEALNTRRRQVMALTLKVIQRLVTADLHLEGGGLIGRALVPYYRQLLPVMALYFNDDKNLGDGIDYGQRKQDNIGTLVRETLSLLETYGGDEAFINIKWILPTYESCRD